MPYCFLVVAHFGDFIVTKPGTKISRRSKLWTFDKNHGDTCASLQLIQWNEQKTKRRRDIDWDIT